MGCVRFSVSSTAFAAGQIGLRTLRRSGGGVKAVRLSRSLKVIRAAQVSGVESQVAAEAGGHVKKSGTLYEVLGLSQRASAQDIKRAYRRLARQFHPDAAASAQEKSLSTERFLQIHNAYSILSKTEDRAQYDRQLLMQQGVKWNGVSSRGAYRNPAGHVGRNWETDQCW